jgi:hypothetical protein
MVFLSVTAHTVKGTIFCMNSVTQILFRCDLHLGAPWLKRLVAVTSPRRPGCDTRTVHLEFVVDNVAVGEVYLRVVQFSNVTGMDSGANNVVMSNTPMARGVQYEERPNKC